MRDTNTDEKKDFRIRLNRAELTFLADLLEYRQALLRIKPDVRASIDLPDPPESPGGGNMAYTLQQRLRRPGSARRW